MPEPIDTIRRVNADIESMTVDELEQARIVLDRHYAEGKADVQAARRRVATRLEKLLGYPIGNPPTKTPRSIPTGRPPATTAPSRASAAPRAPVPASTRPKKSGNPVLGLVVLLVIVGGVVYGCSHLGGSSSGGGGGGGGMDQTTRDFIAYDACKDAVSQKLKAPSTADFQGSTSVDYRTTGGNNITIIGYVDAQNSFGAKLRTNWTCSVDVDKAGNVSNVSATITG